MDENNNRNNGILPQMPPPGSTLAFWSLFFGGIGLINSCLPLFSIWNLPANLFFGLFGIVCAVLSKRGKPFSNRAQLGLILSIISLVCGLIMSLLIIFVFDIMDTNTVLGEYFRQFFEQANKALMPTLPFGE